MLDFTSLKTLKSYLKRREQEQRRGGEGSMKRALVGRNDCSVENENLNLIKIDKKLNERKRVS